MKKLCWCLLFIAMSVAVFAKPKKEKVIPELHFTVSNGDVLVENFDADGKPVCKDNVRFLNNVNIRLTFEVYGRNSLDSEGKLLQTIKVKGNDSETGDIEDLKKYKYVYVVCKEGEPIFSKITCERNDMYFYVQGIKEKAGTVEKHGYLVKPTYSDTDFSKYQAVISNIGKDKDTLYENLKAACISMRNQVSFSGISAELTVEYENKNDKVLKGKSHFVSQKGLVSNLYFFVFTIEVKDDKYRILFDDVRKRDSFVLVDQELDSDEYEAATENFNALILLLNDKIHSATSMANDDW